MSSIAPGWYPDPDPSASPGRQRWYDGTGWTAHVAAPPAAAPAAPAAQFAPVYTAPAAQPHAYGAAQATQPSPYGTPPVAQPSPYGSPYAGQPAGVAGPEAPWNVGAPTGGRIVVGSMTKQEVKALPRRERNSKDRPDLDLARGRNQLTYNAVLFGIISLVVNPFLVFSIMAIVWAARGMKRADQFEVQGYPPLGRSQAVAGIVLGIVGTIFGVIVLLARLSSM